MMEIVDKILKLSDLGYSRVEIEKLLAGAREEATKGAEKEEEGTMINLLDEEKGEKKDEKSSTSSLEARVGTLTESLKSLENSIKNMQKANLKNAEMPAVKEYTALDAMASIIRPDKK